MDEQQFGCPLSVPEASLLLLPSVSASAHVGDAGGNSGYHLSHLKTYECFLGRREKPSIGYGKHSYLAFPKVLVPS